MVSNVGTVVALYYFWLKNIGEVKATRYIKISGYGLTPVTPIYWAITITGRQSSLAMRFRFWVHLSAQDQPLGPVALVDRRFSALARRAEVTEVWCRSSYDATTTASYARLGLPHTLGIQNHPANAAKPDSLNKRPQKLFFELCQCTKIVSYPNTTYCSHWSQTDTTLLKYPRKVDFNSTWKSHKDKKLKDLQP